jgi:hypothetical protein
MRTWTFLSSRPTAVYPQVDQINFGGADIGKKILYSQKAIQIIIFL